MKTTKYIIIAIFFIFIFTVGMFVHTLNMNAADWREKSRRDMFTYSVRVEGLSGKEVEGSTTIMVPIPATKDGKFVTTPPQKEPVFVQGLINKYVLNTPEKYMKGPYFGNTTEELDNKTIIENWTTFIVETDDGYMLGFKSNESILEDIDFSAEVVVDNIDIFDPINNNSPILYPIENISEISMTPYGNQMKYSSDINYESYVYLSDNIEEGTKSFTIFLDAHNDPTEWPKEYRGSYLCQVKENVEGAGKIEVITSLKQNF